MAAPSSQQDSALTIPLEFQKVPYSVMNSGISFESRDNPFAKEPAEFGSQMRRGEMQFAGSSGPGMAFLWNRSAGKLYLDLNRNQDLTDDPDGVRSSAYGGAVRSRHALFTNISLTVRSQTGALTCVADLTFSEYSRGLNVYAAVKSFWSGKVVLEANEWQIGVIATPGEILGSTTGRQLLLRPWRFRNEPFTADGSSADAFPFSSKLFVQSRQFEVTVLPNADNGGSVQLTEQSVELGEIELSGNFIQRLILHGDHDWVAVVDDPGNTIRIPVGNYGRVQVQLARSNIVAQSANFYRSRPTALNLEVSTSSPAKLSAGGPLTNMVSIKSRGDFLVFSYRLIGADGVEYDIGSADRPHPPRFTVYKNGGKIASGDFEFG